MLNVKKITPKLRKYKFIQLMFERLFPPDEIIPMWMLRLFAMRKGVEFRAFYDGDNFVGVAYTATSERVLYIFYLAVNDQVHSQGYGTQILDWLKANYPNKILTLNIEPLCENAENYAQRVKRLDFYKRNDFGNCGFDLVIGQSRFWVLSTDHSLTVDQFKKYHSPLTPRVLRWICKVKKREL